MLQIYYFLFCFSTGVEISFGGELLSHDFDPNPTYEEAKTIGADFKRFSPHLLNLKKHNDVAILFSNEALTAFNAFPIGDQKYNDVIRLCYDALYRMNVGVDLMDASNAALKPIQINYRSCTLCRPR